MADIKEKVRQALAGRDSAGMGRDTYGIKQQDRKTVNDEFFTDRTEKPDLAEYAERIRREQYNETAAKNVPERDTEHPYIIYPDEYGCIEEYDTLPLTYMKTAFSPMMTITSYMKLMSLSAESRLTISESLRRMSSM